MTRTASAALIVLLGLSACGGDLDSGNESAATEAPADTTSAAEFAIGDADESSSEPADATADATSTDVATGGSQSTGAPVIDFGRDLIVEAGVTMVTPDVGAAVDDVIDIAARNGGAVYNADVTIDDPLEDGSVPGSGSIVIKVPPTQLDGLIRDLSGVGTLRNQTQNVADVTDQLIDLDIQIRQAFESVERMEAILTETTDFQALVDAETELVQRQTAYERLLAAQRNIDDRVALSQLTVNVQYQAPGTEPAPIVENDPGIGDAFSDGWTAFVGVLFGIAFVLAVIAPFLAIALVVGAVALLVNRRIRRRRSIRSNGDGPAMTPSVGTSTPLPDATTTSVTESDDSLVDASRNQ